MDNNNEARPPDRGTNLLKAARPPSDRERTEPNALRVYQRVLLALIRLISHCVDLVLFVLLLLMIGIGIYAAYDSNQVTRAASSTRYTTYKPQQDDSVSFRELIRLNPDVFAWLTVYGTPIDYPLVQGSDNETYLTMGADRTFAAAGSLFLDARFNRDFTDFNSVIHGHNMFGEAMFGCVGDFADHSFFNDHRYGRLYYDGKEHGLEIIAFIEADAYDSEVYRVVPDDVEVKEKQQYLNQLLALAKQKREFPEASEAKIVLLSTCDVVETNGRMLLVGSITDNSYINPYPENKTESERTLDERIPNNGQFTAGSKLISCRVWLIMVLILLALILLYFALARKESKRTCDQRNDAHSSAPERNKK